MKCALCSSSIQTTFLGKILGTHVKDAKGKLHTFCFECQKKFPTKAEILAKVT